MVCVCCDTCPEKGSCCVNGSCVDYVSESECSELGGAWQGCCSRCHPTRDLLTGVVTFPCGDTSTPTCCNAFSDRYSQVVITLEGLAAGPQAQSSDCSCMNSTYVFDINLGNVGGNLVQFLVREQIPGALLNCPLSNEGDVWCEILCRTDKTVPQNIKQGVLSLFWQTFNRNIEWQYRRSFVFDLTVSLVANKSVSGNVCSTTCDDLIDAIETSAQFFFESNNRCDRSNAVATATFQ
jgi:hypothetical protein